MMKVQIFNFTMLKSVLKDKQVHTLHQRKLKTIRLSTVNLAIVVNSL